MYLVKENDVYKRERKVEFTLEETITFKHNHHVFEKGDKDWYITVALEKSDKVTSDRHQLTSDLLLQYRWAIREGFNHMLDPNLKNQYDYPRHRNTVKGITDYIKLIRKKSNEEYIYL